MTRIPIPTRRGTDGFKHADHWLAESLGGQWSRRHGYTVASANRAAQFELLRDKGFEPSRRYFNSDRTPYHYTNDLRPGAKFTLREALIEAEAMKSTTQT